MNYSLVVAAIDLLREFAQRHCDGKKPIEIRLAEPDPLDGFGIALFWHPDADLGLCTAITVSSQHEKEFRQIVKLCEDWRDDLR